MPVDRRDGEFGSRAESHPYVCATAQKRPQLLKHSLGQRGSATLCPAMVEQQ